MCAARAANIHNRSGLLILDAEIRRRSTNQPERRGVVHAQDRVPLLIGDLVDHTVPGVAGIVDDVVDLAAAKLGGLLDQDVDVVGVRDVAGNGDGAVRGGSVDLVSNGLRARAVDVADDDFAAFVGEEAGCFGTDALARTGDAVGGGQRCVLG